MMKFVIPLVAGSAALFAGAAQAAPLNVTMPTIDNGVEQVRLVCNEWGRCYRTRGPRAVYVDPGYSSYNYYAPSYGYGYRPYRYYSGPSVGFGAPGVSFGFGFGGPRYW